MSISIKELKKKIGGYFMKHNKKEIDWTPFIYLRTEKEEIKTDKNLQMSYLPRKGERIMYNGIKYEIVDIIHHYNMNFQPYVELFVKEVKEELEEIIIGRRYINVPPIRGEDLINSLLINGKYAGYDEVFSDEDIYIALQKCKNLIYVPCCDSDIPCDDMSPLSARQGFCSGAAIKLIMENEYNRALHEFEDCIDDYGKGRSRCVTKNELILYNCILTCFIEKLEKQVDK